MGKTDEELRNLGYKNLGWANGWGKNPPELDKCKELNHSRNDISYSNRGTNNTVYCDICKIYYKYDCGD